MSLIKSYPQNGVRRAAGFSSRLLFAIIALPLGVFAALPQFTSKVPDLAIYEGQLLQITIKATDADHDSLSYSLFLSPTGMTLPDSVISWTPTFSQAGKDTVICRVTEHPSLLFVADTFEITVLDVGAEDAYTEVTSTVGLGDAGVTNALAWGDFNKDNLVDVFLANAGGAGKLYQAASGGVSFTASSAFSGVSGGSDASSAAWADYDHDGRLDLYVANSGLFGGAVNRLYRNGSSGVFTDVTSATGTGNSGLSLSCSWVDFDKDGDPDIYVVNYGGANELYSNNGNGTFTALGDSAGVDDTGDGVAAAWCDFDLDSRPDLYLVNENGVNHLFRNNGDSTFTDASTTAGVGHTGNGSAAAWGDYDNDGDFDLFLANKDSVQVLYSNNGNSTFTRLGTSSGLSRKGTARSVAWLDFDMDGNLDLLVTFSDSANRLYQNLGDSTFVDVASLVGMNIFGYWSAATWADPANQGVPDVYLGRRDGQNKYFNGRVGGAYLKVRLHGVVSNRTGIGARVKIRAGGKHYSRWVDGGSGSMSEPVALFGLDNAAVVDSLTVFWPCGLRRDTTNVAINSIFTWFETDSLFPDVDSTKVYPDTNLIAGPFVISTKVTDNNSLNSYLWYSTNRGAAYTRVTMTAQGGGKYQGNIPGQASGTRVYYYVIAVDSVGHIRRDPYFAPDSFYSFSVDDSVPYISSVTVLPDTNNTAGPYTVRVRAADDDSLRNLYLVRIIYQQGIQTERDSTVMSLVSSDTLGYDFKADLSGRALGTQISYYVRAVDLAHNYTLSPNAVLDSVLSFKVAQFSARALFDSTIVGKGSGVEVADYDLDGRPDIFLSTLDTTDYLLKGSSDSTFTKVSNTVPGTANSATTGGYWGDFNNDRYPDLYLAVLGSNRLLANNRNGTFTDITTKAGVGDAGQSWAASWVDYDNDGRLDLFVVNSDGSDRLYRNNGDSTFTDRASTAGLAGAAGGVACAWADYDRDGYQDVHVVYYGSTSRLYRNLHNGTFSQTTSTAGVAGGTSSVSAVWFDYNNDLLPDLLLVEQAADRLFRSNGNGTFTEIVLSADGLSQQPGGFGAAWMDYDNDGYPDLLVSRGETGKEDRNAVLHGKTAGALENYTFISGITESGEYRGVAWLDYNRDGKPDLLVGNNAGRPRFYRNIVSSSANNWLRVSLLGTRSNAPGIGAEVSVFYAGKAGLRRLGGDAAFTGSSEPVLHFGLGSSSTVDSLVVRWPSGMRQSLSAISANRVLNIVERDTLYPGIVSYDTIPDQFTLAARPVVKAKVRDRDSLTTVVVRYTPSTTDSTITAAMTRDSVRTSGQTYFLYLHYTMPVLTSGATNRWRIKVSDSRGSADSTQLFQYTAGLDTLPPVVQYLSRPDTVLPDTAGPYIFSLRLTDQAGVAQAAFNLQGTTRTGAALVVMRDTTFTNGRSSFDWMIQVPGQSLGASFKYYVSSKDILNRANKPDTFRVRVAPKKGKAKLNNEKVNVSDLLRLAYIILGKVSRPGAIDSLGLDLDGNGSLNAADLALLLALWAQPSSASLLAAGLPEGKGPEVRAELLEQGDRIIFYLDNPAAVPFGLVELGLPEGGQASRLDLIPSTRLQGMVHAEGRTVTGSLLLIFLPGGSGQSLAPGDGELFRVTSAGALPRLEVLTVQFGTSGVTVDREAASAGAGLPKALALEQNAPNPFNPSTTISFALPAGRSEGEARRVTLEVFNLRGALVCTLLDGLMPPGYHQVNWSGVDGAGRSLPSGVYFYRLRSDAQTLIRKMILLK